MYGDTGAIRALAGRMRRQADEVRALADRLVGEADAVPWTGWAADALRAHARERGAALRRTARAHDDAADALDRHAAAVQRLQDLIAATERRVRALVADARDRLAELRRQVHDGLTGLLPDPVDRLLDGFRPPPSGDRAWLEVHLPGLGVSP